MKKTISINIASTAFFIDEDAYQELNSYLKKLESWFRGKQGGQEVINDIENRMSELFRERINPKTGVISIDMVKEVIEIMGQPEDFIPEEDEAFSSDDQTSGQESGQTDQTYRGQKRLYRDMDNKVLGGVCAGMAAYFNIDPVVMRILFVLLAIGSLGMVIFIYIVLWLAMPVALTTSQKLEMRGENVTISSIEKTIKGQYKQAKDQFGKFKESDAYRKGEDYMKKISKRDQTVLIVVAVLVGLLFFGHLITGFLPFVHVSHFHLPFSSLLFPGLIPVILILVVLGVIFRSAFKGFLILILILIAISIMMRITGFIHFFPWIG